jgi:DNA-binding transcriptional MerR regulator
MTVAIRFLVKKNLQNTHGETVSVIGEDSWGFVDCISESSHVDNLNGIKRLYSSISEVGQIVDEEQYVLRYWETEFEQLRPQKNRSGNRVYTEYDVRVIQTIKHLLRTKRYTIDGAKEHLKTLHFDTDIAEAHENENGVASTSTLETELVEAGITGVHVQPVQQLVEEPVGEPVSVPVTPLHTVTFRREELMELRDTLRSVLRLLQTPDTSLIQPSSFTPDTTTTNDSH